MYISREKTALHGQFAHPSRRNRPLNRFYPFRFLLIVTIMKVPLLAERPVPVPNPSAHSPFLSSVQKEMRPYQHRATARILLSFFRSSPQYTGYGHSGAILPGRTRSSPQYTGYGHAALRDYAFRIQQSQYLMQI